ncbi:beta-propeller fold lactonase family protein [Microbacterium lacticum]
MLRRRSCGAPSARRARGARRGPHRGAEASDPAPERVSRAHQARFLPRRVVATTDLGYDLVRFFTERVGDLHETQRVPLPRGSGPRHTVWHPSGHLYVVTELSLEVCVLALRSGSRPGGALRPARRARGANAASDVASTSDRQRRA